MYATLWGRIESVCTPTCHVLWAVSPPAHAKEGNELTPGPDLLARLRHRETYPLVLAEETEKLGKV